MEIRPECRLFSVCPTSPCRRGRRACKLNNEEKKEDEKKKKENDEKEEEMEGNRRDEEDMQDSLVVEDGIMVNFPLVSFPCISCCKVLSANKKLGSHTVAMHNDPASCIL